MNHPWSSWKEHYKKNYEELDPRIQEIVDEKGYTAYSTRAYHVDRRLNKRARAQYEEEEEESEEDDEENNEENNEDENEDDRDEYPTGEFVLNDDDERPRKKQRLR